MPELEELDGLDGEAVHFLAFEGERAVGCARMRRVAEGVVKIERVAVSMGQRRTGVGKKLMDEVEAVAGRDGQSEAVLSSQVSAIPFYLARGYVAEGELFEDAGIQHRYMRKKL